MIVSISVDDCFNVNIIEPFLANPELAVTATLMLLPLFVGVAHDVPVLAATVQVYPSTISLTAIVFVSTAEVKLRDDGLSTNLFLMDRSPPRHQM